MRNLTLTTPIRALAALLACGAALSACAEDSGAPSPPVATGVSVAYDLWRPGPNDDCTAEIHNSYSVVGPDGKLYPTWHPPVDPTTGCRFGHEHGRDPRGSDLYRRTGPIPFGYANEQLAIWDPTGIRNEDHFGHKVEWENDVPFDLGGGVAGSVLQVKCDVLTKLHQGTHSKDAFTNNLHELVYHIDCTGGTRIGMTIMTAIGTPGEMVEACDHDVHLTVGPPTPLNSPDGGGKRTIPDKACVERHILVPPGQTSSFGSALHESWQVSANLRADNGHFLASVNPYYQVFYPSRFYDPALPNFTGRVVDLCFATEANGDRANGWLCDQATANGTLTSLAFDDPRSPFNGVRRQVDINGNRIDNADGPEVWYTDPFGNHGRTAPFPGSIRQVVAKMDNTDFFQFEGPTLGGDRNYGGQGVHAPN
ncbi:MAG TPA: hypothetical protein PK948_04760 [Gemmatimonadales bacterium]|nr:hypothetical protein [Gemmatimonadales bacterium]